MGSAAIKTNNIDHLNSLINSGVTITDLANCFKVSRTAISNWLRVGQAPGWTLVASEGLRRRLGSRITEETPPKLVLIRVPGDVEIATYKMLDALGVKHTEIPEMDQ